MHGSFLIALLFCSYQSTLAFQRKIAIVQLARSTIPTSISTRRTVASLDARQVPDAAEKNKAALTAGEEPTVANFFSSVSNFAESLEQEKKIPQSVFYSAIALVSVLLAFEAYKLLLVWSIPLFFGLVLAKIIRDKAVGTMNALSNGLTMGTYGFTANADSIAMILPFVLFTTLALFSAIRLESIFTLPQIDLPDLSAIDLPQLPALELPFELPPSLNLPSISLPTIDVSAVHLPTMSLPAIEMPTMPTMPTISMPKLPQLPEID